MIITQTKVNNSALRKCSCNFPGNSLSSVAELSTYLSGDVQVQSFYSYKDCPVTKEAVKSIPIKKKYLQDLLETLYPRVGALPGS